MKKTILALLAAAPLAALAQDAVTAPTEGPRVYLGAGAGVSTIGDAGNSGPGRAFKFRVGVARSPRLLLGVEAGLESSEGTAVATYDVGATFFPWRRWLYVRGAAGLSTLTRTNGTSEQGANLLLGVGVALGRPRGFTVSLNLDTKTALMSPGGGGGDHGVSSASAWLGVDWY